MARGTLKAAIFGAAALLGGTALAAETVTVSLILPMTGPFASTGRQIEAAAKLYVQENGAEVNGCTVELVTKDDTGTADVTKRIAQEAVVREGADVLAGFGLTPLALAAAPIATQANKPMVVMAAATSIITEKSPYIVRTSFTLPQAAHTMGEWAAKNGIKKAVTLVSDYAPGVDAETYFVKAFEAAGGEVPEKLRVPLQNPDFAPFLQRAKDAAPDALFVFVPSGVGSIVMKQFADRGLADAGVKLIGTGDVTDDDILNNMGDVALGAVTAFFYSAAHDSPENKAFVEAFKAANPGMRPNFFGVSGYDGMHVIYEGLKKTGCAFDGETFVEAVKGLSWTSPRGEVTIEADTRDITQTIYIREVKRLDDGELYNVEFDEVANVKDPAKAGQ
ncbi:ABC transporter substrate-binding protein [Faunimonas sp. B44]|uniref:ABC transporter substrate-binding protein n=1 Tax=Faunimonas sp. B44 TaxID=3461493 RepID=UPI004044692F